MSLELCYTESVPFSSFLECDDNNVNIVISNYDWSTQAWNHSSHVGDNTSVHFVQRKRKRSPSTDPGSHVIRLHQQGWSRVSDPCSSVSDPCSSAFLSHRT